MFYSCLLSLILTLSTEIRHQKQFVLYRCKSCSYKRSEKVDVLLDNAAFKSSQIDFIYLAGGGAYTATAVLKNIIKW